MRTTRWAAALAALLLALGAGFIIGTAVMPTLALTTPPAFTASIPQPVRQATVVPSFTTADEQLFHEIYRTVSPSVVSINVIINTSQSAQGSLGDGFAQAGGTGFVIDQLGHIVTNYHVVEGAERIEVNFFDGRIVRAEVVGTDPDSDLAVIRVSDVPAEALIPVTFGNSAQLFVGQEVIAIGSPFNQPWTMTTGIISALERTIRGLDDFQIGSVIQTDAAINPGNSGGPLLNLDGSVIGVNSQIISRTQSNSGIGFAIPSNLVQRVASALIETGDIDYSYLGIGGDDVSLYLIEALDMPNTVRGAVVTGVAEGSPAAAAGLQEPDGGVRIDGVLIPTQVDIITGIDGTPITSMSSLVSYLAANTQPGQTVNLSVLRNGREQITLPLTLGARPE